MNTQYFELTLLEPTVLQGAAQRSVGDCLGFVPGANLLGIAAKQYGQAGDLAWEIFHSGAVRFGDARLVDEPTGAPAIPIPLNLRAFKGTRVEDLSKRGDLADLTRDDVDRSVQWVGLSGQVGQSGRLVTPQTEAVLRTAIDRGSQRAEKGQLFENVGLCAGQRFRFAVRNHIMDPDQTRRAGDLVSKALCGRHFLGRSRSAEHGAASIALLDSPWSTWPTGQRNGRVSFLCVSETCFLDPETGLPTSTPVATDFGLAAGKLEPAATFVRMARWVPFNSKRCRPDLERITVTGGSVFTFSGVEPDDLEQARRWCERGVGVHRAEGFGDVLVQPKALSAIFAGGGGVTLAMADIPTTETRQGVEELNPDQLPDDALGRWLRPRIHQQRLDGRSHELAKKLEGRLTKFIKTGPSPSQWRQVVELSAAVAGAAPDGNVVERLKAALFDHKTGLCETGVRKHAWAAGGARSDRSAKDELKRILKDLADSEPDAAAMTIYHLATQLSRRVQERRNR